jgi:serine protease Do
MPSITLDALSTELANLTAAAAGAVVQAHGARRPASGVVHGPDTIVTTAHAIGREDGLRVRRHDGEAFDADLAGWDPASGIAVLRAPRALDVQPPSIADVEPRAGHMVVAIARSWSNAVTATTGTVAVVGGPLRTGRRRELLRVIRVTAPMHDGFAGGGVFDSAGRLVGIATAASIRGFGVVIPAAIVWAAAGQVLTSGTPRRGFIGVAVQPVQLPAAQRSSSRERGLLVMGVTPSSRAEAAGVMVGDVILDVDGRAVEHPSDLLDLLTQRPVGQIVAVRAVRGGSVVDIPITIGERG